MLAGKLLHVLRKGGAIHQNAQPVDAIGELHGALRQALRRQAGHGRAQRFGADAVRFRGVFEPPRSNGIKGAHRTASRECRSR